MSADEPRKSLPRARGRAWRVVLGLISMLVIVAVFAAALFLRPFASLVDRAAVGSSAVTNEVSTEQLQAYCPSRMDLVDTEAYGDSEFQVSTGNVASSARYAAFGSVYRAQVSPLGPDYATDSETLADQEDGDVLTLAGDVDDGARVMDTRLLASENGTGSAASVVSWATEGDIQGLSASTCVVPSLEHAFLLTDTQSGVTQQLIVANPTDRATAITIQAWGTADGERLALSTGNTMTVDAYGEASVDLGAAASGQDGVYVTLSSDETPVAAVVRTVRMDGLTARGSDYALPVDAASRGAMLPGVREGDETAVEVFGESDGDVTVYWVGEDGLTQAAQGTVSANRVAVFDLQTAPEGVRGVFVDASTPVAAGARIQRSGGDGQADFALVRAAEPAASSAVVLPDGVDGELTLMNDSSASARVTLHAYDADGVEVDERTVTLDARSAQSLAVADLEGEARMLTLDDEDAAVGWGVRLSHPDVDDAGLAGIAYLGATALTPVRETVSARNDQSIVR
ncbi:DUF5719 family protein [Bifidobacterium phasiani]|uniref:Organic solvents resistance ABC transporter permease n=1 Tax=Bifidobacterium phasiani TaxID=2834431 RepID=A0ABS6W5V0_9BIFI|nr:DUF5719 family protein [Bifidobacterium phasiani]MBW3081881.1 hypothetical protein [Bifidobacterium phasiani]